MIIIEEFLARLDVAHCVNEDAVVFLDCFAVWIAGMIDQARVVTANFRIDYIAVFQSEVESVWIVIVAGSGFPGDAFACVFNDARAFGNELPGVNASAVDSGLANFDLHGAPPRFAFLRHTQAGIKPWLLTPASGVIALFFDRAAYSSQVCPKRVTRIARFFLQISRKLQLFA